MHLLASGAAGVEVLSRCYALCRECFTRCHASLYETEVAGLTSSRRSPAQGGSQPPLRRYVRPALTGVLRMARRLDNCPHIERHYDPDDQAMLAALRAVLGLPRRLPHLGSEEAR
jgi:hypothetical protein